MSSDSKRFIAWKFDQPTSLSKLANMYYIFVAHGLLINKYSGTSETCITTLHINFLTVNCSLYVSSPYGFYTSYVDTMT